MRIARALSIAAGLLASLVTSEVVCRLYAYEAMDFEPGIGWVPAAGVTRWWHREGNGAGTWTAHGIRRASLPPPGTPSVLVLGDSFVEARGVNDDEVFTAVLERDLATNGHPYAVLNAGIGGMTPPYYLAAAPTYEELFHPRWTVVVVEGDDVTDAGWGAGATHFARDANGALIVVPNPVEGRGGPLRKAFRAARARSALLECLTDQAPRWYGAMRRWHPFIAARPVPPGPPVEEVGSWPIADELDLIWKTFDGRVTLAYLAPYDPKAIAPTGVETAVLDICRDRGRSCVSLRDSFAQFRDRGAVPYGFPNSKFGKGHLNAAGHAALAGLLDAEIERLANDGLL